MSSSPLPGTSATGSSSAASTVSTTSDPSSSTSSSSSPQVSAVGSNLYLFAFLSALVLLLVISCSIVCRGIYVRRRYRRQVAHALARGLVLAPAEQGSEQMSFGAQPRLFDVWLADQKPNLTSSQQWSDIIPISVLSVPSMEEKHPQWTASLSSAKWKSTVNSEAPSEFAGELMQVSVLISMPQADDESHDPEELPNIALGFAHSYTS